MDGTLLDLAFDNYFWQKLVPETYGEQQGISPAEAQAFIRSQYKRGATYAKLVLS